MTAVILNHGTPEHTRLAVRSLQASAVPPDCIIVVDNGSPGGSAVLRGVLEPASPAHPCSPRADPECGRGASTPPLVIDTGRNLGFSAGMNVGIRAALERGTDLVLLVNSDVSLAPDATRLLLAAAREHHGAGIFAPLVVSREEPHWIETAGIAYARTTARMRNLHAAEPVAAAPSQPFEVPGVSGCVMLIRRAALEKAGVFDEEYFFSFEDVELCLRAGAAGFKSMCVPQARAYHERSATIGRRSPARIYFATRNHLRLASALDPSLTRRTIRAAFIVGLNTAYVLTSADAPLISGVAAVARGTRDHLLGRYGRGPVP